MLALKHRNALSEQKLSVHLIIRDIMFFLCGTATGDSVCVFGEFVFDRADLKNYKSKLIFRHFLQN